MVDASVETTIEPAEETNPALAAETLLDSETVDGQQVSMERGTDGVWIVVEGHRYPIAELVSQVDGVRAQREKMETEFVQERALRELAHKETQDVRSSFTELEGFVSELQELLGERERQLDEMSQAKGELEGIVSEIQTVIPVKEEELETATGNIRRLTDTIDLLNNSARERERMVAEQRSENERLKARGAQLDTRLAESDQQLVNKGSTVEQLTKQSQALTAEVRELKRHRDELAIEANVSRHGLESQKQATARAKEQREGSQQRLTETSKLLDKRQIRIEDLTNEEEELKSRMQEVVNESHNRARQLDRAAQEKSQIEEQWDATKGLVDEYERELDSTKKTALRLTGQVQDLTGQFDVTHRMRFGNRVRGACVRSYRDRYCRRSPWFPSYN